MKVATRTDFTWKVGGQQGEGIDSTGEIFAQAMHRKGYYVYAYRHFMSRIKGGHTHYKIRLSPELIRHRGDQDHLLIAFDQESIDYNLPMLAGGAAVVYDASGFEAKVPDGAEVKLFGVPMTKMAEDLGMAIMKNMVAVGVTAAMLDLDASDFESVIMDRFGAKGEKVVQANRNALAAGYEYCREHFGEAFATLPPAERDGDARPRLYMSGNDALALGALAAGCRLIYAYPITPATEILYTAFRYFPKFGGAIVQGEDEMAACFMAIGANYSGVRAMTSTSGPGLSLMMEAFGLAGMSETPLVIVDVQRAGPSTGLPTKTEQGDINTILYGSHGESPRIVLYPGTVEDCFYMIGHAFNLAERYQCPVILISDLALGVSKQSIDPEALDLGKIAIDRGLRVTDEELAGVVPGTFARYKVTESGISPRPIPGQKNGRFTALGNEHSEKGEEEEHPQNRVQQMQKRMRKLRDLDLTDIGLEYHGPEEPDLLIIGLGSSHGPITEARRALEDDGASVAHLQLKALLPLPEGTVGTYIGRAKRTLVVEQNFTGQLAGWLKQRVGFRERILSCLKYDGDPFTATEILKMAREVV